MCGGGWGDLEGLVAKKFVSAELFVQLVYNFSNSNDCSNLRSDEPRTNMIPPCQDKPFSQNSLPKTNPPDDPLPPVHSVPKTNPPDDPLPPVPRTGGRGSSGGLP